MSAQVSEIEDLVAQAAPIQIVLRLLCLANLTTGGIKTKVLENLKREILQVQFNRIPLFVNFFTQLGSFRPMDMLMSLSCFRWRLHRCSHHCQFQSLRPTKQRRHLLHLPSHRSVKRFVSCPRLTMATRQISPMCTQVIHH